MRSFLKYNWPSILWAAFIFGICMMPGRHVPKVSIPHFDKVVHVSIYLVLAVLTYWGWMMQTTFSGLRHNTFIKVVLVLALYGYTIEVMQGLLTVDRNYDIYDALANSCGAIIGAIAMQRGWRSKHK